MKKTDKGRARLLKENRELKVKCAESHALLTAIKKGTVDAFVTDDHRVFTLKNADQAYRVLVETMSEGAATLTYDGTIMYCNKRLSEMLGRPMEKIVGTTIYDIIDKDDSIKCKHTVRQCKIKTILSECRLKKSDGKFIPVLLTCNALPLNGGGLSMVVADLTQIKKTERELQRHRDHLEELVKERTGQFVESEKKFRLAFENARDAMLWADTKTGILVDCNASAERLFERPKHEIVGLHQTGLHPMGDIKKIKSAFQAQASGDQPAVELPIITKSGKIKTVLISASVVDLGKQRIVQGIFRDITERKQMETLLAKKAQQQQAILDSTPAFIFFKDKENRFLHVNRAFAQAMGLPKEELEGKSLYDLYPKKQADKFWKDDLEVIQNGKAKRDMVEMMQTPRGNRIVQTDKIPYFDDEGNVIGVIGFTLDITERKRAEDALINTARIKSEFTNMVSHELRTPLTALKESISQVSEGLLGNVSTDQQRILDISKRNVDRLARLIGEILDFQALETGKISFKIGENDINEVAKETGEMMSIVAEEKGLEFILHLADGLPRIRFDRDKVSQVISNLVNNSIKFTEHGSITISTAHVDNVIQVSIKDTGMGIKDEDMPRLFQRYEQLERRTGGTGLGLAISAEIIKNHGGKIWVESNFGQGTTVYFTLPIHERRS